MAWPVIAAMAAIGFMKGMKDEENAKKDAGMAAIEAKYSPWTKIAPRQVREADKFGSTAQGALGGISLDQNITKAAAANKASAGYGMTSDSVDLTPEEEKTLEEGMQSKRANSVARKSEGEVDWSDKTKSVSGYSTKAVK